MRVLSIVPPFFRLMGSHNNRVSLGLHPTAEICKELGHWSKLWNVDYEDSNTYPDWWSIMKLYPKYVKAIKTGKHKALDDLAEGLKLMHPDVVIIAAGDMALPTVDISTPMTAALAADVVHKVLPEAYVVGYGPQLWHGSQDLWPRFDCVVLGEIEASLQHIIEQRPKGPFTPELVTDEMMEKFPILTPAVLVHPIQPPDWDYIMSSRGCLFHCRFCFQSKMAGLREMSPSRFMKELLYRYDELGTRGFYVADMIFPLRQSRTMEICRRLKEARVTRPDLVWWCESRVDTIDDRRAKWMAEAGCTTVKIGVETGHDEFMKMIGKGITTDQCHKAIQVIHANGMKAVAYVMVGAPGADRAKYQEQLKFMRSLAADHYVTNVTIPYPGTDMYDYLPQRTKEMVSNGWVTHLSSELAEFWGIPEDVLGEFFALGKAKEDGGFRKYVRTEE